MAVAEGEEVYGGDMRNYCFYIKANICLDMYKHVFIVFLSI